MRAIMDRFWRLAYRLGFRAARLWWRLRRPAHDGAVVAVWLDDLSRVRLTTGSLAKMLKDQHVVGVTTNPTIFAGALSKGAAYAEQLRERAAAGADVEEAVFAAERRDRLGGAGRGGVAGVPLGAFDLVGHR